MISPHTPPGTVIVAVWLEQVPHVLRVFKPEWWPLVAAMFGTHGEWHIRLGQRCTLTAIEPKEQMVSGFIARIAEYPSGGFPLECFDVAVLPKSITDLLEGAPVDAPAQPETV